jgi:photosystem II PsbH protein
LLEQAMETTKYPPKKVAPIQYLLRKLNSNTGMVVRGWGTAPIMAVLMLLFLVFFLIILEIANSSILLEGINIDWSVLSHYGTATEAQSAQNQSFSTTGIGIFLGLVAFGLSCVAFIVYGFLTYPADQE